MTTMRGCTGFEFLRPLISDMILSRPATENRRGYKCFEAILVVHNPSATWKLRSRTSSRRANIFQDVGHMFSHWKRIIVFLNTNDTNGLNSATLDSRKPCQWRKLAS